MHFATVGYLDIFDLASSLKARLSLLRGVGAGGERRVLMLRGPRKEASDPDDDLAYAASPHAGKWPEYKAILGHIQRLGEHLGGIEFGRIQIEMLMPRTVIPWQAAQDTPYAQRFECAHLPLRTNPNCITLAGNEVVSLAPGYLTTVSRRVPTSAVNWGDHPRIHLILDVARRSLPAEPEPEPQEEPSDDDLQKM